MGTIISVHILAGTIFSDVKLFAKFAEYVVLR